MNIISYPFDSGEILRKRKTFKKRLLEQNGLLEKRVAILSGSTIGDIADVLEIFLLNFGIKPLFYVGQYGRFYEEAVFENQKLADFKPEIIYIHTTARNLSDATVMDNVIAEGCVRQHETMTKLRLVWERIKEVYSCPIIQNNFELSLYEWTINNYQINELNIQMAEYAENHRDFYVNDIQCLSAGYGLYEWYDDPCYFLYKYAFNANAIPLLCHSVAKIIKAVYGKNQKCLVLDLDNTLWGGVVGEVGVWGIELGVETPAGEAYTAFQRYIKTLHNRGIFLAVCSKNDEHIAKEAFGNPNMVLQLEDIAVFRANWEDKADNIVEIARALNILLESIVFVDDNPAERERVRQILPEVKVAEVDSPVDFVRHMEGAGYFYSVNVSGDDVKRNEYYTADTKRNEAKSNYADYGEYLKSLRMSSEIRPFTAAHLDRVTQLINKTNQFNLTARRYSLSEIEKILAADNFITLYATLDDKFGSNGIVSALIGEIVGKTLHARLWVMSCRVFKRDLEYAVFDALVDTGRKSGLEQVLGYYFETKKNGYVSGLLADLGFNRAADDTWIFDLTAEYQVKNKYIKINAAKGDGGQ